jgi:hypothetical protein
MDIVSSSIQTHIVLIFGLFFVILFNLINELYNKSFVSMAIWLKRTTPLYHGLNFAIVYSGAIVSAYVHNLAPEIILMIPTALILMILEIKRFKKQRIIRSTDFEFQKEFRIYAKEIYKKEMILLVVVSIISLLM